MKVKVCGITNIEDAKFAIECGADALGFIFYEKSKRYIKPEIAKGIIASLPFFVMRIGVFVNEEIKKVNEVAKNIGLNAVQLHGDKLVEYCENITFPVIKVFSVDESFDYNLIKDYSNYQIMLDTFSNSEKGGTGKVFNWNNIPSEIRTKIILAGGISESNIEQIYRDVRPQAVDLSSSLEIEPGRKDHNKVKSFFTTLNNLRNQ